MNITINNVERTLNALLISVLLALAPCSFAYTTDEDTLARIINASVHPNWSVVPARPDETYGGVKAGQPVLQTDSAGNVHAIFASASSLENGNYVPAKLYYYFFDGLSIYDETVLPITEDMLTVVDTVRLSYDLKIDSLDQPTIVVSYNVDGYSNTQRIALYGKKIAGSWNLNPVIAGSGYTNSFTAPNFVQLALDSQDVPYISYRETSAMYYISPQQNLWHVGCVAANVDLNGEIVIDNNDVPHGFFTDAGIDQVAVYHASPGAGNVCWKNSNSEIIHEAQEFPVGFALEAVADNQGGLHLAYTSMESGISHLYYNHYDGSDWQSEIVDEVLDNSNLDIYLSDTDQPLIAYFRSRNYPRMGAHQLDLATFDGSSWTTEHVFDGINRNEPSLVTYAGKPLIALDARPYYTSNEQGYGAGWTTTTMLELSDPWFGLNGFDATNMNPYNQTYNGIVLAYNLTRTPEQDVPYVTVGTQEAGASLFIQLDEDAVFKSRMPSGFDATKNMHATISSSIDEVNATALGDFDNDGFTDMIIAGHNADTGTAEIEFHRKTGSLNLFDSNIRSPAITVDNPDMSADDLRDMAVADFNEDGNLDLVVSGSANQFAHIMLYWGNGDGSFSAPDIVTGNNVPHGIDTEDINSDGHADIAVAGNYYTYRVDIYLGDGSGQFTLSSVELDHQESGRQTSQGISLADFDGDTFVDLVLSNYADSQNNAEGLAFYRGYGTGDFVPTAITSGVEIGAGTTGMAFSRSIDNAYFDGDDTMDLVIADNATGRILVYSGDGDGRFSIVPQQFYHHPAANSVCSVMACVLDPYGSTLEQSIKLTGTQLSGISTAPYAALDPAYSYTPPDEVFEVPTGCVGGNNNPNDPTIPALLFATLCYYLRRRRTFSV